MKLITLIVNWFVEVFRFCPRYRRKKLVEKPFLIIGHRGSPAAEVENTIPSFERALKENANALEMDICLTKDQTPVIYHDWDPDSMVSILRQKGFEPFMKYRPLPPSFSNEFRRPINQLTLKEFRQHYHFKLKDDVNGDPVQAEIPTLEEFFEWSVGKENLKYIFLDIKVPGDQADLVLTINGKVQEFKSKYQTKFEIIHETAEPEVLSVMKKHYPEENYLLDSDIPPGLVLNPKKHSAVNVALEKKNQYALMTRPRQVTVGSWATYRRVIANDIKILAKILKQRFNSTINYFVCATISNKSEMKCLVIMGINGIMTDYPAILRTVVEKYKRQIA
jgi:glycerophosphoryl diester phosphodiesterase